MTLAFHKPHSPAWAGRCTPPHGHRRGTLIAALAGALLLMGMAQAAETRVAPADVRSALGALAQVDVIQAADDGVPSFLRGDLGRAPALDANDLPQVQRSMARVLAPALATLRLKPADLRLRKVNTAPNGTRHLRYHQTHQGLDVIGGDLVVHIDSKGKVFALNGTARGDIADVSSRRDIGDSAVHPTAMADKRFAGMETTPPRKVIFMSPEGQASLAYETVVTGLRGMNPVRDKVYVSAETGAILGVHPQIHFAKNRRTFSANGGLTLPGILKRAEGAAATTDADVNAAYDGVGATYDAFKAFWNRDSYDNAGAPLVSTVHYDRNLCNAYWDGSSLVYGDGDTSANCQPLARAPDVVAHEFTHALTASESRLVYAGESGGLNEAFSDIFAAFTEAWVDGGRNGTLRVSANTWTVGEKVIAPALRFMNDPAADGLSLDFRNGSADSWDVHHSSGIANLAFYLMSQGGLHPRNKSRVVVAAIGMDKAIRVFYEMNVNLLTSNARFPDAANASVQAAVYLGYTLAEQAAVADAWRAVGVPVNGPTNNPGGAPQVILSNDMPVTVPGGSANQQTFYKIVVPAGQQQLTVQLAGGTGDADLYTRPVVAPTLSQYGCRSETSGNTETCTILNPPAGDHHIMVLGYATYNGVKLTASYAPTPPDNSLVNGSAVTIAGAAGSTQFFKISVPAGKTVTITMSGGTGDADLHVRFGAQPTTATYDCRPYQAGTESCVLTRGTSGDYHVMVRGYRAFSGVRLKASY
jgi:vibriolysin